MESTSGTENSFEVTIFYAKCRLSYNINIIINMQWAVIINVSLLHVLCKSLAILSEWPPVAKTVFNRWMELWSQVLTYYYGNELRVYRCWYHSVLTVFSADIFLGSLSKLLTLYISACWNAMTVAKCVRINKHVQSFIGIKVFMRLSPTTLRDCLMYWSLMDCILVLQI